MEKRHERQQLGYPPPLDKLPLSLNTNCCSSIYRFLFFCTYVVYHIPVSAVFNFFLSFFWSFHVFPFFQNYGLFLIFWVGPLCFHNSVTLYNELFFFRLHSSHIALSALHDLRAQQLINFFPCGLSILTIFLRFLSLSLYSFLVYLLMS
jgi:hypothetical protein